MPKPRSVRPPRGPVATATVTTTQADGVTIVDCPESRLRQPSDLVGIVLAGAGIVVVLVLSVYARYTTQGVTEDAQSITRVLNELLQIAVSVLEGLATLFLPIAVVVDLAWRRQFRDVVEGIIAFVVGVVLAQVGIFLLGHFGPQALTQSLTITVDGHPVAALAPFVSGFAAMLTAVGPRSRRKVLSISWNVMWVALGVEIVTGAITLPSAVVTVLLGLVPGHTVRYVSGVRPERAYGTSLVAAVRRAGVDPRLVVRVTEEGLDPGELNGALTEARDPVTRALDRHGDNRVYAVTDTADVRWDVVVLDSDRQVIGVLAQFWQAMRLRTVERRTVVSLRQATERAALLSYSAAAAGVRTPHLVGIGERPGSMLLVQEHPIRLRSLREMTGEEITETVLDGVWSQLATAHRAGLAHRSITVDTLLVGPEDHEGRPRIWMIGWENGDVASSETARRIDCTQMLALLALRVGPQRAVASADRSLGKDEMVAIAPLLQTIALPPATREEASRDKDAMDELRSALVARIPAADVEPMRMVRFGWRTVIMVTLLVIAAWIVLAFVNFDQIIAAAKQANPVWMLVAFGFGLTAYVGAALALMGFSPVSLRLWRTILVQVAASVVALVAPGLVGPAALNLSYLRKRKVQTPLAVATVTLMQVSLFVTTIVLLLLIFLATGDSGALSQLPSGTVIAVVLGIVALIGAALAIPRVRTWVWAKVGPTLTQVWPRVVWVLGQPRKLALGLGGNFLITLSYLAAFWACLQAFGVTNLSFTTIALTYLVGNSVGSAVPTPGGLGTVELALAGGLGTAGVPAAIAASVAVLFRALTYWGRVPLGYVALRHLQRRDVV